MKKIGRKRQLDRSIEMLHQKTLRAFPKEGCGELDIPTPKNIVVDFLVEVPHQQRKHYMQLLKLMSVIEEERVLKLSRQMTEYYSRYLP